MRTSWFTLEIVRLDAQLEPQVQNIQLMILLGEISCHFNDFVESCVRVDTATDALHTKCSQQRIPDVIVIKEIKYSYKPLSVELCCAPRKSCYDKRSGGHDVSGYFDWSAACSVLCLLDIMLAQYQSIKYTPLIQKGAYEGLAHLTDRARQTYWIPRSRRALRARN